jgi:hypothetical protein
VLEPVKRLGVEIKQRIAIAGDLRRIRLAMKQTQRATISLRRLDRKLTGHERK